MIGRKPRKERRLKFVVQINGVHKRLIVQQQEAFSVFLIESESASR
jgi:hypothetical protein